MYYNILLTCTTCINSDQLIVLIISGFMLFVISWVIIHVITDSVKVSSYIEIDYFKPKLKTTEVKKDILYKVICYYLNKLNKTTNCRVTIFNERFYVEREFKNYLFNFYYVIGNRQGFKEKTHAIEEINFIGGKYKESITTSKYFPTSGSTFTLY